MNEAIIKLKPHIEKRTKTLQDAIPLVDYIVKPPKSYENILCGLSRQTVEKIFNSFIEFIKNNNDISAQKTEKYFRYDMVRKFDLKMATVVQPVRVAITGKQVSLPLFDTMEVLGKEDVIKRMESAKEALGA